MTAMTRVARAVMRIRTRPSPCAEPGGDAREAAEQADAARQPRIEQVEPEHERRVEPLTE
jgi:hypothetical protein